jgi:hypothetical protein
MTLPHDLAIPALRIAPESLLRRDRVQNSGQMQPKRPAHVYEIRPRKDHRGVDLISNALPFGGLWYEQALKHARKPQR